MLSVGQLNGLRTRLHPLLRSGRHLRLRQPRCEQRATFGRLQLHHRSRLHHATHATLTRCRRHTAYSTRQFPAFGIAHTAYIWNIGSGPTCNPQHATCNLHHTMCSINNMSYGRVKLFGFAGSGVRRPITCCAVRGAWCMARCVLCTASHGAFCRLCGSRCILLRSIIHDARCMFSCRGRRQRRPWLRHRQARRIIRAERVLASPSN